MAMAINDAYASTVIQNYLALRANFVQLLQFYLLVQCSRFISVIVLVSRHICFKQNLAQIIT